MHAFLPPFHLLQPSRLDPLLQQREKPNAVEQLVPQRRCFLPGATHTRTLTVCQASFRNNWQWLSSPPSEAQECSKCEMSNCHQYTFSNTTLYLDLVCTIWVAYPRGNKGKCFSFHFSVSGLLGKSWMQLPWFR